LTITWLQGLPGTLSSSLPERAVAPSDTTCLHVVAAGGRLQECLPADGQADPADPIRLDVAPAFQEVNGGAQVLLAPVPGIGVRIAIALALAAAVEDEDSVAVARKHAGGFLRPLAAEGDDHRRAVSRGHVRALQHEPVARVELDVLHARAAEVDVIDGSARHVGAHVA
jgi:hypothetical protein